MKLKTLCLITIICVAGTILHAQDLSVINLRVYDYKVVLGTVKLKIGDVMVSVNQEGRVRLDKCEQYTDATIDEDTDANDWQPGHIGRIGRTKIAYIDRYDGFDNIGKVKLVNDIKLTYYDRFDLDNQGKIKSIGNISFTYYDRFDMDNQGKLKSIGNIKLEYYDRFDADNLGKLKHIGNTYISYYDRFDHDRTGMVKSIRGKTPLVNVIYL